MPVTKDKIRKEVWLDEAIIEKLQKLAEKENQSLKSYMEKVLIKKASVK